MAPIIVEEFEATDRPSMRVFQTLPMGKIGQAGAPGRVGDRVETPGRVASGASRTVSALAAPALHAAVETTSAVNASRRWAMRDLGIPAGSASDADLAPSSEVPNTADD
jgi:hypothetical protein